MKELLDDLLKSSVISKKEQVYIEKGSLNDQKKALLAKIGHQKKTCKTQLLKTLQKHKCVYLACKLTVSQDFENKDSVIEIVDEILSQLGMKELLDDLLKSSVISKTEQVEIEKGSLNDQKKALLAKMGQQKKTYQTQLVKTLQKHKCVYLAFKLTGSQDFENKDFIKEIIGEILKNLNTEEVLHDLERGSVISAYDKYRIEEYRKPYDRKNALLNLVIKRRDPALQLLVKKLPKHAKDSINKILDKILENVSMDKTVSSMMQSSWMSADDKRCIEKQDDRKACLQKIVINEKDQALLQLVKLLPIALKDTDTKISDSPE